MSVDWNLMESCLWNVFTEHFYGIWHKEHYLRNVIHGIHYLQNIVCGTHFMQHCR